MSEIHPVEQIVELSIDELLTNNEDIEIIFFYKDILLDKNTSFFEIFKED